jgi:ribokinase
MSAEIIVIGSLNMDLVVSAARLPGTGETIMGESFAIYPGGKGANQAIAAARLGGSVKMVGCVGRDTFGESLLDNLTSNNVDITAVGKDSNSSTGIALITVDNQGSNTIIVVPGANHALLPHDLDGVESIIASSSLVVLQMEIPIETVAHAIDLAKKHKIPVMLNPAPAQQMEKEVLAGIEFLIPNESELAILSGLPVSTMLEIRAAAEKMLQIGVKRLLMTRGDDGVYYVDYQAEIILPAYSVQAVDTTAAGDAFIGALAVAFVNGEEMDAAIRYGLAAGALAVTKAGAQTSLPTKQELELFLKDQRTPGGDD